jgi:hypothetical protein
MFVRRPIFTHVFDDGSNVNILVDSLLAAASQLETFVTALDKGFAQTILKQNAIDFTRLHALPEAALRKPILFGVSGGTPDRPDVLLIDGHHRYVRAAQLGHSFISCQLCPEAMWRQHTIDLPAMTQDELEALPPHTINRIIL